MFSNFYKMPKIEIETCQNIDVSWSILDIDFADPLKGTHYLVVVDSFF